jgi:oligoendopeptidase F
VASTFNENMLMQHLLKTEKDDLFKLFVLDSYLDQVRGTLFRQTLFAEFELAMHQQVEQGKTLTAEWLNRTYLDLTREYYGHNKGVCEVGDYIQVEWSRIPHFYMNYYVFQYSTGLIASMALSDMVLGDPRRGPQQYLAALKAGGSDHPIAILKKAGVDMNDTAPYQAAFRRVNLMLDEMEKIVLRLQETK